MARLRLWKSRKISHYLWHCLGIWAHYALISTDYRWEMEVKLPYRNQKGKVTALSQWQNVSARWTNICFLVCWSQSSSMLSCTLVRESMAYLYMDFQKFKVIHLDINDFWMSVFNSPFKCGCAHWYPSKDVHARTFYNGCPWNMNIQRTDIHVFMDISIQLSMLSLISIWMSIDFYGYGYPCMDLLDSRSRVDACFLIQPVSPWFSNNSWSTTCVRVWTENATCCRAIVYQKD